MQRWHVDNIPGVVQQVVYFRDGGEACLEADQAGIAMDQYTIEEGAQCLHRFGLTIGRMPADENVAHGAHDGRARASA